MIENKKKPGKPATGSTKPEVLYFRVAPETRVLLDKLTVIHERSMTNTVEFLIKQEGRKYGLVESREIRLTDDV